MNRLPTELLDQIFSQATYNTSQDISVVINNPPLFEYLELERTSAQTIATLQTKRSLTCVCLRWRALATKYLFEEIHIRNNKLDITLAATLEASAINERGKARSLGSYVRRIIFRRSVSSPCRMYGVDSTQLARRIIACCPNVLCVSHDRDLLDPVIERCGRSFKDPYGFSELSTQWSNRGTNVQRLDYSLGNVSLDQSLTISPAICYNFNSLCVLSISIDVAAWAQNSREPTPLQINLPNVHTLRLFRSHIHGKEWDQYKFKPVDLPALRRLSVAELPLYQYIDLLRLNAQKIRIFEFGISPPERDWSIDRIELDGCLLHCPNLEELHFPVFVSGYIANVGTFPGSTADFHMPPIRHAGLHAIPWRRLERSNGKLEMVRYFGFQSRTQPQNYQEWSWRKLRVQVGALTSSSRLLERITLYGFEWTEYLSDDRFMEILKIVSDAGVTLQGDIKEVDDMLSSLCTRIHPVT